MHFDCYVEDRATAGGDPSLSLGLGSVDISFLA
jgi:hypothetical protein